MNSAGAAGGVPTARISWSPRTARWAMLGLCGLVAVTGEVYLFAVRAPGRVEAKGEHEAVVHEFGAGVPIKQTFTAHSGGLDEVRVLLDASQPTHIVLTWTFLRQYENWHDPLFRGLRRLDLPEGRQWFTIRVPSIPSSAGLMYRVDLQLMLPTESPPQPVGLVASRDNALRGGSLIVGEEPRWGDLIFETRSAGDTLAGRYTLMVSPNLVWPLRSAFGLVALLDLLIAGFAIGYLPRGAVRRSSWPPPARLSIAPSVGLTVILATLAGTAVAIGRHADSGIDLIEELYQARMDSSSQPLHWTFDVKEGTVDDETRGAIWANPVSVLSWTLTVPQRARMRTWLALDPTVWPLSVDGVVFRVGVEQDGRYAELLFRHVDPGHVADDRRWIPIDLDLSPFAGRPMTLSLRTEPSMPGHVPNSLYDWALWGTPQIVTRDR